MFFNPDGLQTYYNRAHCFQNLAVALRDQALCARVVERRSWWLDGSGISDSACRKLVGEQNRRDIAAAGQLRTPQQLKQIRVQRDNNGHDFDIRVRTSGGDGTGLQLTLVVVDPAGRDRLLHVTAQPMDEQTAELSIFIPADRLIQVSGADGNRPVRLRAYLERVLMGDDDRAVHAHAPGLRLRSSAETVFVPASLKRTPE